MNPTPGWGAKIKEDLKNDSLYIAEGLAIDVGMQIGQALEARGMNRKELASVLKIKPPYISEILNGTPNLTLLTLSKLAVALNKDIKIALNDRNLIHPKMSTIGLCMDFDVLSASSGSRKGKQQSDYQSGNQLADASAGSAIQTLA